MPQPLVTVLMPVYNAEKYLYPALKSVLKQTYQNLEILIINDGSTDKSEQIIFSFKDPRIRYIKQPNSGVGQTLRRGVEMANGEIIRRMDADDIISQQAIEIQLRFLQEHPEVGVVATQQCFMTENGRIAYNKKLPNDHWFETKEFKYITPQDFSPDKAAPIVHATTMFYKELVLEVGNYRPWFKVAEDYDLWLRILERKKIAVIHKCLYFVRIHNSSATKRYDQLRQFYNNCAIEFAKQRKKYGSDELQQGKKISIPTFQPSNLKPLPRPNGSIVREDLNFLYSLAINAHDWKMWFQLTKQYLRYGWKKSLTYKLLLIPLLGERLTTKIVKIKRFFKKL